ncbi:MAG TPA: PadR family transcriptional regulator [Acetobacteraceae bacterium]|nr:PadR family transcriptional regulator [Acetobacteraceae bacterium]
MHYRFDHEEGHGCHGHGGRRFMRGMLRGRMGGGGRMFEQGALRLVILRLIADAPRHGYELIKEIEERLGGAYSPSPGVIYPTLTLLEEQELIRQEPEEGGKKRYAITEAGQRVLAENAAEVEALFARMAEAGAGGAGRAQLFRAMHNVRTALRLRLARGRLTEEELRRVVAVLDSAAQEIERS